MAESEQEQRILQAAEYALGTLEPRERSRFETQLMHDAEARRELAYWETRLGALGLALRPADPPAAVWDRVTRELGLESATPVAQNSETSARHSRSAANDSGPGMWRGLALVASVAALVMAGFLFTGSTERSAGPESPAAPAYASVVYDEPTGMSWLVTAHANSHKMTVVAMGDYEVPEGKVLRAWLKPENGEPVLLGKWPNTHGDHEMTVSDTAAQHMNEPAKLMVSMEDAGTSAQASVPSGKLMWTSPIARRTG
ncbi:hypothetical protein T35B1_05900 [Salinisphaera shabanensis T35B1]|uniref:anti-sigma factor n=1 Tax=Salinisphaera shabanensis TaxID=180542 RepID=UPI00333E5DB9